MSGSPCLNVQKEGLLPEPVEEMKDRQTREAPSTTGIAIHRLHEWRSTFKQFVRYGLVGGVNTLIDVLMLNVLLWHFPTNNALVLMLYNSVAYSSGAVTSFFLNKYWTFGRTQRMTVRELGRFAIILALEILYSNGLVWLAGKALQTLIANPTLWGNVSKLVAIAGGAILSYTCMRFWTFAGRSQERAKQQVPP